jgi:hypothetical protein
MKRIPSVVINLIYLFYLYLCLRNLFGDTDPVMIGLDIFCGATCLAGIALFAALALDRKPSPLARHYPTGMTGSPAPQSSQSLSRAA